MLDFFHKYLRNLMIIFALAMIGSYIWFIVPAHIFPGGEIGRPEWLLFWGSMLSFGGTVFLGTVALWGNEKANEENRRAYEQTEKAFEQNEEYIKLISQDKVPFIHFASAYTEEVRLDEPREEGMPTHAMSINKILIDDKESEIYRCEIDATEQGFGDASYKKILRLEMQNFSEARIKRIVINKLQVYKPISVKDSEVKKETGTGIKMKEVGLALTFERVLLNHESIFIEFAIYFNKRETFEDQSGSIFGRFDLTTETVNGIIKEQSITLLGRNDAITYQASTFN